MPGLGPGARAFSYARQVSPIIGAFIFVSLVELPVVHLLLPWDAVRIGALVVSVWGLLWMVGLLASMKVYPHLIDDAGRRIRYGTTTDIRVPGRPSRASPLAGAASRLSPPTAEPGGGLVPPFPDGGVLSRAYGGLIP